MGIGVTELLMIFAILIFFLPALIVGLVLWRVFKGTNLKRVFELESRVERLERQLDRTAEPIAKKDSTLK